MIEIKHRGTGVVLHTVRADTLIGVILRGASLSDADLRGADLRGASLSYTSLRGADLRGADLHVASLSGVNLSDAVIIPGWRMIKEA